MSINLDELRSVSREKIHKLDEDRLIQVFNFAAQKHHGQVRQTGEPYISHSIFVAHTLASWGIDQASVEASLLHDTPDMSGVSIEELEKEFGKEVAQLVEGVTKVGKVQLRGSHDVEFLENLRKMFVSMAQDIRVVLIRLADRLHNVATLEGVALAKQKRIALETMEVYAPLAERLGMGKLKGELEDLAFPYIFPNEYEWVMGVAKPHFKYSEENVSGIIQKIRQQLVKHKVKAKVEGRPKRKYSLYKKLLRPEIDRDITLIHDLMAIRVITPDTSSCYSALGIIHQYWKPAPSLGISDFIAQPKPNGYRSIHTKVFDNKGNIVEIQIRSEEMHQQAEYGAAAHFAYAQAKMAGASDDRLEKGVAFKVSEKMSWVSQLASWQQTVSNVENINQYKLDALAHHIYVFSPKGDVYDLPENSTPIDYAFSVHSDLGQFIHTAKINGRIVPLSAILKSGDVVEILKTKAKKKPNRDWLHFVKTSKARTEIRKLTSEK
ncbi:MAG: RelA/SpoT family protein [Candidatus Collierbacteria bacterium GW2011_GWC2_45_15]|uniref:RelA/SpoT family protein n=1 Tax=Candidatus Collierbacteria bacterium GW2011_GWC2_45_15 TaxID=1618394 RepID=A0A0G1LTC7_9BACT|nr:MAG: RelA/SpoT family protein [Candidatus Collierbacteria bacterium GW2011_GWC2_45_15]